MLTSDPSVLYLHGFASSPGSRKALFFADKLRHIGRKLEIPDFNEGDFARLTISGELSLLERTAAGRSCILIGSSLGGYVAALYAARHPEVERLVLLAPAFGLFQLWMEKLGADGVTAWRARGTMNVFHYAEQREIPIGYGFLEDAGRFEAFPHISQPALIFHGNHDPVVPVEQSRAFVRLHPASRLICLQSGHELTDVLDNIWPDVRDFLSLPGP